MKFKKLVKSEENFNLDSELNSFIENIKTDEETLESWINNFSDTNVETLQRYLKVWPSWFKEDLDKYSKIIAKRLCQYKALKQLNDSKSK